WLFGADGSTASTQLVDEALALIAGSRALDGPLAYGLDQFLQTHGGGGSVHCIVFASAEMAPWLGQLRATIARFRVRFAVVLATDGLRSREQSPGWQRLLYRPSPATQDRQQESPALAELSRLLTEVGQLVESTLVVDRHTGQSFDK